MTPAERYLALALRLDRHDDGLVESYYGPADLRAAVEAEDPAAPADLVAEADALLADLGDGFLRDQVVALRCRAGLVAGETWTYAEEVRACFGVDPVHTTQDQLEAAYAELDALLPGPGSLQDRWRAWERASRVDPDRVPALVDGVLEVAREQARRLFGMPEDESFTVEYVRGEAWMAFHEYAGDLRAHVSVNVDHQRPATELLHTVLHETYAGHHAEACLKEVGLYRERGALEQGIVVVTAPSSLVSEGLAEAGPALLLDGDERPAYVDLLNAAGVTTDFAHDRAVAAAAEPVQRLGADAGRLLHAEGWSEGEVREHLLHWALVDPAIIDGVLRFVSEPMSRGYIQCYPQGRALCTRYVDADPADRVERFRTLLTEQTRVGDLAVTAL